MPISAISVKVKCEYADVSAMTLTSKRRVCANSLFCVSCMYQVIDHYENPRNVGSLDKGDKNVGTGLVGAPACGDVMKLQVIYNTGIK